MRRAGWLKTSLKGSLKGSLANWWEAWLGPCACEPPEVFVASIVRTLEDTRDLDRIVARVNTFWQYRPVCGRRRCVSLRGPLTVCQVALLMPVGTPTRVDIM